MHWFPQNRCEEAVHPKPSGFHNRDPAKVRARLLCARKRPKRRTRKSPFRTHVKNGERAPQEARLRQAFFKTKIFPEQTLQLTELRAAK